MPSMEMLRVSQEYQPIQEVSIIVEDIEKPLEHKCGLGAVISRETFPSFSAEDPSTLSTTEQIANTLFALRNRGHDSTGVAYINQYGEIEYAGGDGIVTEAFNQEHPIPSAETYIGHVRYGTLREQGNKQTQPVLASYNGWTAAFAHNGNIPDEYREMVRNKIPKEILEREALELDSAELAWAIVTADGDTWEEKMHVLDDIPCAFQLMMLTTDEYEQETVYALSDRSGMWPLVVGKNENMIVMSSEDTGIPAGMEQTNVQPGQLVKANRDGVTYEQFFDNPHTVRCILQDAYGYNREAHLLPGLTGEDFSMALGRQIGEELSFIQGDVVITGVPQTGLPIAEGVAQARGTTSTSVVEKNPEYNGKRTFIAKDATTQANMALEKYIINNPELLRGKKLIVVDDSAVRGNTFRRLFQLLKNTGLSELYFVSGLPEIVDDCNFGYFIKQDQSLLALKKGKELQEGKEEYLLRTNEEMVQEITGGEETDIDVIVHFLSKAGLAKVYAKTMHLEPNHICSACTGGIGPDKLIQVGRRNPPKVAVN